MIRPYHLYQKIYRQALWHKSRKEACIYLTFDDGPIPEVTPWVLETLKRYNALATFFCVGENAIKNEFAYQQILNEGHAVGNHTHKHLNGWKTVNDIYLNSVENCAKIIKSNLFRPPYGKLKLSQYKKIKPDYKIVMWDVLSYDFDKGTGPEKCLKNVLKYSREGSIIVFHDSFKAQVNLRYTLPKVLDYFTKKGFKFCSL
jgi:peptidoglycan/xylan/chitin deacetylase (PgdA/CDA1 family)